MTAERTIADWIEGVESDFAAADLYFGHGTDNAGDEACWLVLHAAGLPLDGSFDDWGRAVDPLTGRRIEALARERCATRKPLAYLTGTTEASDWTNDIAHKLRAAREHGVETVIIIDPEFKYWNEGWGDFELDGGFKGHLRKLASR